MSFYTQAAMRDIPQAYLQAHNVGGGGASGSNKAQGYSYSHNASLNRDPGASLMNSRGSLPPMGSFVGEQPAQQQQPSGNTLVVNVDSALDLEPSDRFGSHHYYATACYPHESEAEMDKRKTQAVKANGSSTNPSKENCVLHKRIMVPFNPREQLLMVYVFEADQLGETFVGKATVPLADPKLSSTMPWPLVRDSNSTGTLTLNIQLPDSHAANSPTSPAGLDGTKRSFFTAEAAAGYGAPLSPKGATQASNPYGPPPPAGATGFGPAAAAQYACGGSSPSVQPSYGSRPPQTGSHDALNLSTKMVGAAMNQAQQQNQMYGVANGGVNGYAAGTTASRSNSYVPPPVNFLGGAAAVSGARGVASYTPPPTNMGNLLGQTVGVAPATRVPSGAGSSSLAPYSSQPATAYGGLSQPSTNYGGLSQPSTTYGGYTAPPTNYGGMGSAPVGYGGSCRTSLGVTQTVGSYQPAASAFMTQAPRGNSGSSQQQLGVTRTVVAGANPMGTAMPTNYGTSSAMATNATAYGSAMATNYGGAPYRY